MQCGVFAAVVCSSGMCLKANRAAYLVDRSLGHLTGQRIKVPSMLAQLTVMPQMMLGAMVVVEKFREKRIRNMNGQKRWKLNIAAADWKISVCPFFCI